MKKDELVFLKHILESITQIEEYTKNLTEGEFHTSVEKQDAIVRRFEIIGEAVHNIPEAFRTAHPEVAWSKALGMRNKLIHNYFGIDLMIVWDTAIKILPPFKKQIEELLNN